MYLGILQLLEQKDRTSEMRNCSAVGRVGHKCESRRHQELLGEVCVQGGAVQWSREKVCTAQERKRKRKVFKQEATAEKSDRPATVCVCDLT